MLASRTGTNAAALTALTGASAALLLLLLGLRLLRRPSRRRLLSLLIHLVFRCVLPFVKVPRKTLLLPLRHLADTQTGEGLSRRRSGA